jgi:signal transduction histidine kinase
MKGRSNGSCQWIQARVVPVLHEFLAANRALIIARTRAKVATRPAPRATEEELLTGIPLFLDQLTTTLRLANASAGQVGDGGIGEAATEHGRDLLRRGFTVAQVVHDYGGVCQAVTELADEVKAPITAADFQMFNRCLDDAIAQAVTEYGQQREHSITEDVMARSGELAHELRNALGAAMLAFETITSGSVGPRGSTAALLGRSLRRLSELIDSSVAQVRLDAGIRSPERVSMREFIEEVEVGASMEASARGLTLAVTSVDRGIDVRVDRQFLAAAVANLLQNAFHYSRPRGHVSLTASSTASHVSIEVEDQCGGLPPGESEDLFSRFERRSRNRAGMGLGLAISRKSVESEDGELRVRDIPGVGCVFTIDLPRLPSTPG